MACITQTKANQFKDFLVKKAGAYFIPNLEYSIGPYVSSRTISSQSELLYKNIKNGFNIQPLIFCDISIHSQAKGDGHAVCLSCVQVDNNNIVLEFFDSNGLLLPFKSKADMYFMTLFQNVIQLFRQIDKIHCTFIEMNTKDLNPIGHCNSWVMFYFYTRLAYQSLNSKSYFTFVYFWTPEMIKDINKFLQNNVSKNTFNTQIQMLHKSINADKSILFNKVLKLNKNYAKFNYTHYTQKYLPQSVRKQLLQINPNLAKNLIIPKIR